MAADARPLIAVGVSHHSAPVEVRERLALDEAGVRDTLARLHAEEAVHEAMLLSTCNRVELYAVPRDIDAIRAYYQSFRGPAGERLDGHLYWHHGRAAVRHLFRVASSLDSLVLGEPQILGQVKQAVRVAAESDTLGAVLHPLTQRTFSVARRVRNETDIGRSRVGVGNAGVDLALQIFGGLEGKRCMLVGVGEMGRQVATALLSAGLDELLVTNRTFERSVELASAFGGTPVPFERMADYLPRADIVLTATGAPEPVITSAMVRQALRARHYRTLFLIDLSVPRNIDASIAEIEDAYLFNIDDLSQVVAEGRKARELAAHAALELVEVEADRFIDTLRALDVKAELGALAARAEGIRASEVARSRKLSESLSPDQAKALDAMTRAMVKKLLHGPFRAIRDAARDGDNERLETLLAMWKDE